ncbi:uncharacterized protein LOC127711663 [Mytilus californianus]|uniref:uncharacterized protein LOC127711663 n=1 Tax=Mytilus californianus TaxID=6549 RepID=UPI00224863AE|nr:uncharacterized protein LOC127711663 [Mytilus californianus]
MNKTVLLNIFTSLHAEYNISHSPDYTVLGQKARCLLVRKMAASSPLISERFAVKSAVKFIKSLKDFGEKSMPLFKGKVDYEMKQFVAAAIVSFDEIDQEDLGIIEEANRKLKMALTTKIDLDIYHNYSLSFERLVVLMNTPKPVRHGEAGLLDPSGDIRKKILKSDFNSSRIKTDDTIFLNTLKKSFFSKFNHYEYIICIFSHFIPCTEKEHQCAKLIDEFARQHNTEIIISSERVFDFTNHHEAWTVMKSNDNIYCLSPFKLDPNLNQSTSYDDVDVPCSSRALRRENRKRAVSGTHQRSEKKKKTKFSRQKSND